MAETTTPNAPLLRDPDDPDVSRWYAKDPGPAPMPISIRNPESRLHNNTRAWFFHPPKADMLDALATTGLPEDVFISCPCWQPHQVRAKEDMGEICVTPIHAHGEKVRGSPYVALMPPKADVWEQIVTLWSAVMDDEVAVEETMLEQAGLDLQRATEGWERQNARRTIRVLSTRIHQLQTMDYSRALAFFQEESRISLAVAKSPQVRMMEGIREDTQKQIDETLDAHFQEHTD